MSELLDKLSAPFPPATVSWRLGPTNTDKTRGLPLAYIDSRDVQDRLNEVCGTDWQVRFPWAIPGKMTCEIGIKVDGEWIWRGDGAGDTDVEAEKGSFSDGFKRAAVRFGIGRYLYDVDAPWVAVEKRGNSVSIPDNELARLRGLLERGTRPTPAATRPATSAGASRGPSSTGERQPTGAAEGRTLSQIRDSIHKALSLADTPKVVDDILMVNQAEMALIKGASAATHSRLLAYAEGHKKLLAQPAANGSALAGEVLEALGQP